jgi:hypothetical protein
MQQQSLVATSGHQIAAAPRPDRAANRRQQSLIDRQAIAVTPSFETADRTRFHGAVRVGALTVGLTLPWALIWFAFSAG